MATKWVNFSTGSNSNNGNTKALAYLTLAYAQTQTSTNDTIIIVDGTYTSITDTYSWPEGRIYMSETYYNYTINGYPPTGNSITQMMTAIIDGASVGGRKVMINTTSLNSFFYGIWFKNFNYNGANYPAIELGASVTTGKSTFISCGFSGLRSGSVTDARNTGIIGPSLLSNTKVNTEFNGCLFYDNDYNSAGANASLNGIFGINNVNASTANMALVLTNCTFDISGYTYLQRFIGISTTGVSATLTWKNNIVYNSGTSIAFCNDVTTINTSLAAGSASSNNTVYGFTSTPSSTYFDLTTDPLFVDAANRNYNLRPAPTVSPAIDSGVVV